MNHQPCKIKRALISVSDKKGIVQFAEALVQCQVEIFSTGGTSKILREANVPVKDVAEITGFPEIMDGRVKTLHPKVHGGILGLRDQHANVAVQHDIHWIDLVVVNLYPFAATIAKNASFDEAIENIDIGGPAMLRSAAKNMGWVGVVVDPNDYVTVIAALRDQHTLSFDLRKTLATKAFQHTAEYDALITQYLSGKSQTEMFFSGMQKKSLRYGENPHQKADAYIFPDGQGVLTGTQHQGKELSYNNIADADAAIDCVREFNDPACVIVKHANPCGVAVAKNILTAFEHAFAADSISAFGGIVALNRLCDKALATVIAQTFFELIIAPSYSEDALKIFAKKPNLRILTFDFNHSVMTQMFKTVEGGLLVQDKDLLRLTVADLKIVTKKQPTDKQMQSLLFAWQVIKHIKSNAVLIAKNQTTIGIGAGQVSRIDAVELALKKSHDHLKDTVLASDGFFPFRDSIDRIAGQGVQAIIQPGGGIRDAEVIAACDEKNIAMVLTGIRCFKH